ncbi:hypothetical protein J6590_021638 [Homalodisca vitripennis]|nr:hypothetical protein J6590_021638 [Homalodisca vitripennis]
MGMMSSALIHIPISPASDIGLVRTLLNVGVSKVETMQTVRFDRFRCRLVGSLQMDVDSRFQESRVKSVTTPDFRSQVCDTVRFQESSLRQRQISGVKSATLSDFRRGKSVTASDFRSQVCDSVRFQEARVKSVTASDFRRQVCDSVRFQESSLCQRQISGVKSVTPSDFRSQVCDSV